MAKDEPKEYVHQMVRPMDKVTTFFGNILYSEAKIAVLRSPDKFVHTAMYLVGRSPSQSQSTVAI